MFERDAPMRVHKVLPPPPMKNILVASALALFVSINPIQSFAQAPAPGADQQAMAGQVEVNAVKFGAARNGSDSWMETEIALDVKPGGKSVAGQFVNDVRVTLNLGFESPEAPGGPPKLYYRSSASFITLEGGRHVVRFYLPPEVVKRDRLRAPVKFYSVELEAGGTPQTPARGSVGSGLTSAASVQNFQSTVASESRASEGVLMPQHLTPFISDSQRTTPTAVRREPQR
jgi:hypothetical protein